MSYDIGFLLPDPAVRMGLAVCGGCDSTTGCDDAVMAVGPDLNITYNVRPMLDRACGSASVMRHVVDGATAGDLVEMLTHAAHHMVEHPAIYRALNPPNGWGDYEGCVEFVKALRNTCVRFPTAIVRVW